MADERIQQWELINFILIWFHSNFLFLNFIFNVIFTHQGNEISTWLLLHLIWTNSFGLASTLCWFHTLLKNNPKQNKIKNKQQHSTHTMHRLFYHFPACYSGLWWINVWPPRPSKEAVWQIVSGRRFEGQPGAPEARIPSDTAACDPLASVPRVTLNWSHMSPLSLLFTV